jgi:hypothetical protein
LSLPDLRISSRNMQCLRSVSHPHTNIITL